MSISAQTDFAQKKKTRTGGQLKNLSSNHKFNYKIIYCSAKVIFTSPLSITCTSTQAHSYIDIVDTQVGAERSSRTKRIQFTDEKQNAVKYKLKINLQLVFQVFCTLAHFCHHSTQSTAHRTAIAASQMHRICASHALIQFA